MEAKDRNRVVRTLLSAVAGFVVYLAFRYIRQVLVDGATFAPNWFDAVMDGVIWGLFAYFGPDAVQCRRSKATLEEESQEGSGKEE